MLLPPKVFTGSSNPALAHRIAQQLGVPLGDAHVKRFSDGEVNIAINESVRAHDVFVVQSTCYPGNDHIMELLLLIDACRRSSAGRVHAVIPYFGYSRQDHLDGKRGPISAKVVATLLAAVGVDRVITIDLHARQIPGFFDVPVDHLQRSAHILIDHLCALKLEEPVVVAPDAGGVERAGEIAKGMGGSIAMIDRRRGVPSKMKSMRLVGEVKGRDCVLVDDIIDTGSTITEAADLLVTSGARTVRAAVTHPVLSGSGVERLNRSKVMELITSDTIPLPQEKQIDKITVVSVAGLLAGVIRSVHEGRSVAAVI